VDAVVQQNIFAKKEIRLVGHEADFKAGGHFARLPLRPEIIELRVGFRAPAKPSGHQGEEDKDGFHLV
jgi:hypothetical protein